jgi:hypothetical protein
MFDEGNSSLPETKTISGRGLDNFIEGIDVIPKNCSSSKLE